MGPRLVWRPGPAKERLEYSQYLGAVVFRHRGAQVRGLVDGGGGKMR